MNWPAYEAGLRRRGDLTFWVDDAALAGWYAPRRTMSGGQRLYSDLAIEPVLTVRLVFHLALHQAETPGLAIPVRPCARSINVCVPAPLCSGRR